MTELLLEARAPGCFGSAAAHNPNAGICQSCPFMTQCGVRADAMRAVLREIAGVSALVEDKPRRKPRVSAAQPGDEGKPAAPAPPQAIEGVSKKGAACVRAIQAYEQKRGINAKELLARGENPFGTDAPKYLHETGAALVEGGFDRKGLKTRLVQNLTWGDGTAGSHVAIVISALPYLDLIEEQGGAFVIKE